MRTDKLLAIKLRLEGKSYGQIQALLTGVSKSTLSAWLANVVLPESAARAILERSKQKSLAGLLKRNRNQTIFAQKRMNDDREKARFEIKEVTLENLFYIGLALYWAEGYKRPIMRNGREVTYHPLSLTNSDPVLVKTFLEFMKRVCNVSPQNIKANIRIFEHLNEKVVTDYWIRETSLPAENFTKTYVGTSRSSMNKRPFNRLPFGVIQIRISDTRLFHRVMGWLEGVKGLIAK